MDPALKSTWWMWWTNPLIQMHSDQKRRLITDSTNVNNASYEEIGAFRSTLRLDEVPQDGVMTAPFVGLLALLEDSDLFESQQRLSAVTFGHTILKLSPIEWEEKFKVTDKDHIRGLITFKRDALNKSAQDILKRIEQACEVWQEENGFLSFSERFKIVAAIYLSARYPSFARRWYLTLSDSVLFVMDRIEGFEEKVLEEFLQIVEPEIINLIQFLQNKYSVNSEIAFETVEDEKADA